MIKLHKKCYQYFMEDQKLNGVGGRQIWPLKQFYLMASLCCNLGFHSMNLELQIENDLFLNVII